MNAVPSNSPGKLEMYDYGPVPELSYLNKTSVELDGNFVHRRITGCSLILVSLTVVLQKELCVEHTGTQNRTNYLF